MRPDIFQALKNFQEDRPVMNESNNDVSFLITLLVQEVAELQEEPHGMSKKDYLTQEATDVAIFALSILDLLTNDPEMAIMEKIARNTAKYPAYLWQKGTYNKCRADSKRQWTEADNEDFYKQ